MNKQYSSFFFSLALSISIMATPSSAMAIPSVEDIWNNIKQRLYDFSRQAIIFPRQGDVQIKRFNQNKYEKVESMKNLGNGDVIRVPEGAQVWVRCADSPPKILKNKKVYTYEEICPEPGSKSDSKVPNNQVIRRVIRSGNFCDFEQ